MNHGCLNRVDQVYRLWINDQQLYGATLAKAGSEAIVSPWSSEMGIQRHPSCSAEASSGTAQTQTESVWYHI